MSDPAPWFGGSLAVYLDGQPIAAEQILKAASGSHGDS